MKKFLIMFLVLLMFLPLAACTEAEKPEESEAVEEVEEDNTEEISWPEKNIQIVVPYPPGGSTDMTIRTLGEELTRILGQNIVVLNRAGGGGSVGASEVANSKADGYTFTVGNGANMSIVPHSTEVPYTFKDFEPISQVSNTPLALAVGKDFPADTFEEWLDWTKENPGDMRFASAGANSTQQLTMSILQKKEDIKITHIPFDGSPQAVAGVLGGHVESVMAITTDLIPQYDAGEIKILALFADERIDELPEVPTSKELGYEDLGFGVWYGLVGPSGIPNEIVRKMDLAIKEALETDFVNDAFAKMNITIEYLNYEELGRKMERVDEMFGEIVQ